jgi:hypothetical protein
MANYQKAGPASGNGEARKRDEDEDQLSTKPSASVQGKLREIDRHYNAKRKASWKRLSRVEQITAIRRSQLQRLFAARGDRRSIEDVAGVNWHFCKPEEISDRLSITLKEKLAYKL